MLLRAHRSSCSTWCAPCRRSRVVAPVSSSWSGLWALREKSSLHRAHHCAEEHDVRTQSETASSSVGAASSAAFGAARGTGCASRSRFSAGSRNRARASSGTGSFTITAAARQQWQRGPPAHPPHGEERLGTPWRCARACTGLPPSHPVWDTCAAEQPHHWPQLLTLPQRTASQGAQGLELPTDSGAARAASGSSGAAGGVPRPPWLPVMQARTTPRPACSSLQGSLDECCECAPPLSPPLQHGCPAASTSQGATREARAYGPRRVACAGNCSYEEVDKFNEELFPSLTQLVAMPYFRYFKVRRSEPDWRGTFKEAQAQGGVAQQQQWACGRRWWGGTGGTGAA